LHYQRPDSVNWTEVVGESARLIVPLRVLEELDAKKYEAPRPETRQAARNALSWLEQLFEGPGTGPVPIGSQGDTTLEIYLSDRPRWRPDDADEEILQVCHEVRMLNGRAKVVTGDNGFRLRTRAMGEEVCDMPDRYLRSQTTSKKGAPKMVIVLIHWRIKPDQVDEFRSWWVNESIPDSIDGLFGEYLSAPMSSSDFTYTVDDLNPGDGSYTPFVNVGIWADERRFHEVVGHLFNDDAPLKSFESERRRRTILKPTEFRSGTLDKADLQ
jgi:hypothetical protein